MELAGYGHALCASLRYRFARLSARMPFAQWRQL